MKFSTISTAIMAPITFAYAQHLTVENFVLYGAPDSTGATPNYTAGIVVGSFPVAISKCFSSFSSSFQTNPPAEEFDIGELI